MRLLLVDDDAGLRALLRATFEVVDVELTEAENAAEALRCIARHRPDVIVLDVHMPGMSGIELCRRLKEDAKTRGIAVVLLSGNADAQANLAESGANAFLAKPFSPLELLGAVERLAGGLSPLAPPPTGTAPEEQLLLYARDLRRLLEIERGQRVLLERAYRETACALASALESKDTGTRAHSQRVQRYALELTRTLEPDLVDEPSLEYGFLLHDVGKIGIPDRILQKPAALTPPERRAMETHAVLGEQMLGDVAFLQGEGLAVVRSHHERWEGAGYPDGLAGEEIPLGARVFAVADTLDAITSDRPYRGARPWGEARDEIVAQSGRQFDPAVVEAFRTCESELEEIHRDLIAA
ncbi:MAG: response regulator [Actinomycetota bacterium]|nr:response regulator [Actinomycetota bacterium]